MSGDYLKDKIKNITKNEAIELFKKEFGFNLPYYSEDEIQYRDFENDNYVVESEVDYYGGEGQGEEYWKISRILDKKTGEVFFIKFEGFYNSWNGTDWSENDWNIVEPIEVKVIQWK